MPTILRCAGCGAILQECSALPYCNSNSQKHPQNHPQPLYYFNLYERFNGECPRCKRQLPSPHHFVNAIEVEVKPNPATLNKSSLVAVFHHDYHKKAIKEEVSAP
jgi:hypothetical protein